MPSPVSATSPVAPRRVRVRSRVRSRVRVLAPRLAKAVTKAVTLTLSGQRPEGPDWGRGGEWLAG